MTNIGRIQKLNRNQWDKIADKYQAYFDDNPNRVSSHVVFPNILNGIGDVKGLKILDFGCGQGRFSRLLNDKGTIVTAYDESIEELKKALDKNDGRKIIYISKKPLLKKEYYDIVFCFMVLICNDLEKLHKLLDDVYSFTKNGGRCIFVNTNTETLGKKFKDFYSKRDSRILKEGDVYSTIIPTSKGRIIVRDHYYSKKFLTELFKFHGFTPSFEEIIADQFVFQVVQK